MPPPIFWFKVPSLPSDVYGVLKALRAQHGLSYWQAVILATHCLVFLAKSQPGAFQGLVEGIKVGFPDTPPPTKGLKLPSG
jgi:hypothetical protein